MSRTLIA